MAYRVTIDARVDDDWGTLWEGEWRSPPFIGMTFELRTNVNGRSEISWWRVVGVHLVMFADEEFSSGRALVYAQSIDIDDVAPKED